MGILPMLFSYPQALVWGTNRSRWSAAGRSSGCWSWLRHSGWPGRLFGLAVAGWAIVPLVFSSMGTIWLSGRITGGHLLDPGLAHAGVRGPPCLSDTRRLARARPCSGSGAAWGSISTRCSCSRSPGLVPAAVLAWLLGGTIARGNRAGRGVPGRDDGRPAAARDRPAGRSVRRLSVAVRGDLRTRAASREHARLLVLALPAAADRRHRAERLSKDADRRRDVTPGAGHRSLHRGSNSRRFIRRRPKEWLRRPDRWSASSVAIVRLARRFRATAGSGPAGVGRGATRLGAPDRGRVPGEPEHLQLRQLPLPDLPADPLVAGLRARAGRPGAARPRGRLAAWLVAASWSR